LGLAAAFALAAGAAHAADYYPQPQPYYPEPQPQPIIIQQPAPVVDFSEGWYLRGYVGIGLTSAAQLSVPNPPAGAGPFRFEQSAVSDAYFVGGGVGYEWNNWLRFELTAEYRGLSELTAFGSFRTGGGVFGDQYHANLKSWLFMANAFVDLGTWNCFTPFVGAGIGTAWNTMADFTDIGIGTSGRGVGRGTSEWHLAWALYAGVSYSVTKNFKVDLTYRYLDLGSFHDTIDCFGGCGGGGPLTYELRNVHSHDIMLGFRWACCDIPAPPQIVYTPPPPPPPIRSKG
jgi:opacity protein-like surface antigen